MKTYSTTVAVGQLIAFFGWVVVLIAAVLLVLSLVAIRGYGAVGIMSSIAIAISGLVLVAQGQLMQAVADTARNTSELVELLRTERAQRVTPTTSDNQALAAPADLNVPRNEAVDASARAIEEEISAARARLDAQATTKQYRGYTIVNVSTKDKTSYRASGSHFDTIDDAAQFIDRLIHATRS